jgi:hypothetical protein
VRLIAGKMQKSNNVQGRGWWRSSEKQCRKEEAQLQTLRAVGACGRLNLWIGDRLTCEADVVKRMFQRVEMGGKMGINWLLMQSLLVPACRIAFTMI